METKEELMGRILTADAESCKAIQNGLLKEDGATPLRIEVAQDYINELEAQIKLLSRSKGNIQHELDLYKGEYAIHNHFKAMLIQMLQQHEVVDIIKDEVLDGLPDVEDIEYRVSNLEDEKMDDYYIIDTVVDSTSFEDSVADIVIDKLSEVKFKVTIEE
jgi:hypothetical protein